MKTVLVITHWYYPLYHGGVPRVAKFCKYLSEFGVTPVLIAPDWQCFDRWAKTDDRDCCEVIRVADDSCINGVKLSGLKKKLLTPFRDYEDMGYGKLEKKIYEKALEVCRERKIDVIFASSFPQYIHRIADKLHRQTGIKWTADYRDLINQEKFRPIGRFRAAKKLINSVYRSCYIARDKRYIRSASHITTVSEALRDMLVERNSSIPVTVIMNGFDPEDYAQASRSVRNEKLTFRYTGSTYGGSNVDCLGEGFSLALKKCPELKDDVVFEFYGTSCGTIGKIAKPYPEFLEAIKLCGNISHDEVVRRQCAADVLYLISHKAKGIVTGKIFEYLAAGKRIVSIPGDGDTTDRILRESGIGTVAGTPDEVCDYILDAYREWKENGILTAEPDEEYIMQYSRRGCAQRLAEILENL